MPVDVAPVFDEVRALIDFQQLLRHKLHGRVVILRSQLGEARMGLALEDAVHVSLQDGFHVLGMDVHDQVDRRSLGYAQQVELQRQVGELRQQRLEHGKQIRDVSVALIDWTPRRFSGQRSLVIASS